MFMQVAGQLIDHGRVDRAFLGVTIERAFDAVSAKRMGLHRPLGALIKGITQNSPALRAELRPGDVILSYEGVPVADDNHLVNLISFSPIGKEVSMIVFRDRKEIVVKAKLAAIRNFELEP